MFLLKTTNIRLGNAFLSCMLILLTGWLLSSAQVKAEDDVSTTITGGQRWCELEQDKLEKLNAQLLKRLQVSQFLEKLSIGKPEIFIDLNTIFGFDVQDENAVRLRLSELSSPKEVQRYSANANCTELEPNFSTISEQLGIATKDLREASIKFLQLPAMQRRNFLLITNIGVTIQEQQQQITRVKAEISHQPDLMTEASLSHLKASVTSLELWSEKLFGILRELSIMNYQSLHMENLDVQQEIEHFFAVLWTETFSLSEHIDLSDETLSALSTTEQAFLKQTANKLSQIRSELWFSQANIKLGVIEARKLWSRNYYSFSDLFDDQSKAIRIESQALYFTLSYPLKAVQTFLWLNQLSPAEKASLVFQSALNWAKSILYLALLLWLSQYLSQKLGLMQDTLLLVGQSGAMRSLSALMGITAPYFYVAVALILLTFSNNTYLLSSSVAYWFCSTVVYIYLIYRLFSIFAESVLIRIADNAGKFLSGTSLQQITERSNRLSRSLLILLIAIKLIEATTGQGYIYHLGLSLLLLISYIIIKRSLDAQAEDIQINMDVLLNRVVHRNTPIETKTAHVKSFTPLLIIPIVISNTVILIHNQLMLFSWYRRLFSHSISIKSLTKKEVAEVEEDETDTPANYETWFSDKRLLTDLPYINTGLLANLTEKINNWITASTLSRTAIICGEKGMGKTCTLQRLTEQCNKGEIKSTSTFISLPTKITTEEGLRQLLTEYKVRIEDEELSPDPDIPRVIIIDDAHHLFLTQVGHLSAIRLLLKIMRSTRSKIFWIISMNNLSWNYLRRAMPDITCALDSVNIKRWTPSEIRSLILSRHHRSQFKLEYNKAALSATSRTNNHAIRTAEQRFFYLLSDLCQGNPAIAQRLWLKTVDVQSGRKVVAMPPKKLSTPDMSAVPTSFLFVYASILIHHSMSESDLVLATSLDPGVVSSALRLALDKGFIKQEESRCSFHLIHFHFINNYLQRKNMLHE